MRLCQRKKYFIRKVLIKKYTENVPQKLLPDFDLVFVNSSKKSMHSRKFFVNKIFLRENYQKLSKSLASFYLNLVSFYEHYHKE